MSKKLSVFDRRIEMILFIMNHRTTSYPELSNYFSVCIDTVHRDIDAISRYVPIVTRQGVYGGIFVSDNCDNKFFLYLTDEEKNLLSEIKLLLNPKEVKILDNILYKCSMTKNRNK